ncbi:MAG: PTS system mannose/fructose/sorbose family transporter subunit IID [Lactobacillus crispatus]|nr:PTS system mannose/fructose/sorbose family transporter subunit IID [Lactobacillus crispatus]
MSSAELTKTTTKAKLSKDDKSMLKRMFWRSWTLFSSFTMVKMQGYGFEYSMFPAIDRFYKNDKEKRREAIVRHSSFFNCTYETAPFIMGLSAAMEKENANNPDEFDAESINALKASLMGPLSGIGDSIFWGTVRLIAAGVAIPLAMQGNILAPFLFLLIYELPSVITRWELLKVGYTSGEKFLKQSSKSGLISKITDLATVVGMMMVGAMTASSVTITTTLKWGIKGATLNLQKILDGIFPGLLPLAVTLIVFALLRKKVKAVYLLFGMIVIGILGALIGIF